VAPRQANGKRRVVVPVEDIATYQTLDQRDGEADLSFFLKHYSPGYLSIVEAHGLAVATFA
jgi:hypothetical protein